MVVSEKSSPGWLEVRRLFCILRPSERSRMGSQLTPICAELTLSLRVPAVVVTMGPRYLRSEVSIRPKRLILCEICQLGAKPKLSVTL